MRELPSGWMQSTIEQIADVIAGQAPPGTSYNCDGNGTPLYQGKADFDGLYVRAPRLWTTQPSKIARPDDVLLSVRAPVGPTNLAAQECAIGRGLAAIRGAKGVNQRYLLYALRASAGRIEEQATGTTFPAVSTPIVKSHSIPLAPRGEQERIVAAIEEQFSRLDAGVAALERVRRSLRILRAAFLDDLLQDCEGNEWPRIEFGEVLVRGRYGTSTKCSYEGRGLPVLRIPNVQSGLISLSDVKYAIDTTVDLSGALVSEGDILVIRTNGSRSLIGRTAVVPHLPKPTAFASYLIQLCIDRDALDPEYLVNALASPQLRLDIERLAATTAGQYNISLDKLRSLRVPVPPLPQQAQLLATVERRLSSAAVLESELNRISTMADRLRSSILVTAFSGKLVPQDPNDEPASVLLERIAAERASANGHKPRPSRAKPKQGVLL